MTSYRVPPLAIELGTVLEAAVRHGGKLTVIHEWRGMRLLTDEDAFTRAMPRLYLVRGKPLPRKEVAVSQEALDDAAVDYRRWNKREADALYVLDSKIAKVKHGRCMRLDYKSDKWHRKGRTVEYTHDFTEERGNPPLTYTDSRTLSAAKTVVLIGGSMRIKEGGIS